MCSAYTTASRIYILKGCESGHTFEGLRRSGLGRWSGLVGRPWWLCGSGSGRYWVQLLAVVEGAEGELIVPKR